MDRTGHITIGIAGIECCIFGSLARARAPLVFVVHGAGGNIESNIDRARDLAAHGCTAVTIEQRNHGRRLVDRRALLRWHGRSTRDFLAMTNIMYEIIVGTASDISLLIGMLPARIGIAPSGIGVTGFSLGGHVTLMAAAMDTRIDCAVPFIGSGDYHTLMRLRTAQYGHDVKAFDRYYEKRLQPLVKRYDPIEHVSAFVDRPLAMINGGADDVVQLPCNENFHARVRPLYTDKAKLRLSVHENVKHEVTKKMWAEGRTFLLSRLSAERA
ncbi:MAG: prolyl oligopeptidase family serine peptidase [Spirochaetota bacterium]